MSGVNTGDGNNQNHDIQNPHQLYCKVKATDISINIPKLLFTYCQHGGQTNNVILLFTLCDHRRRTSIVANVTQTYTNIVAHHIILIITSYPPAGLNYDPEPCHYHELTLLSLSSSFFNHSKSLYLLLTQESFSLKMGRFVCTNKEERKHTKYPLI